MTTTLEQDALALLLRSKTALGRLNDAEVHGVLAYLEGLGWTAPAAQVAQVAQVLPAPPLSPLASLEATIEKDVKAFFEPAPPPVA